MSKISENRVVVLFGGSSYRRTEVIHLLSTTIKHITVYGTLSEEEGMAKIEELGFDKVHLVLIGGRYTVEQRIRIKNWLIENGPHIEITEPGIDYPYSNRAIVQAVRSYLLQ